MKPAQFPWQQNALYEPSVVSPVRTRRAHVARWLSVGLVIVGIILALTVPQ